MKTILKKRLMAMVFLFPAALYAQDNTQDSPKSDTTAQVVKPVKKYIKKNLYFKMLC